MPTSPPCPSRPNWSSRGRSTSVTGSEAVHQGVVIEAEPLQAEARSHALGDTRLVRGARPGDRPAQCRRDHALGRRLRRRRADHHGAPQPARIRRAGQVRVGRAGAHRPDRGEEPRRRARRTARRRLPDDRARLRRSRRDGKHFRRRKDRAGARRRGQGPAPEDARNRHRARPPRHARRHPLAQRVERGGGGALRGAEVLGANSERANRQRHARHIGVSRESRYSYSPLAYSLFTTPPRVRPSAPAP